jgi:hypothetical protein
MPEARRGPNGRTRRGSVAQPSQLRASDASGARARWLWHSTDPQRPMPQPRRGPEPAAVARGGAMTRPGVCWQARARPPAVPSWPRRARWQRLALSGRSGQLKYISRPKSEAMRVTRQLRLPPRDRWAEASSSVYRRAKKSESARAVRAAPLRRQAGKHGGAALCRPARQRPFEKVLGGVISPIPAA